MRGFTLLEVLIALTIIAVAFTVLLEMLSNSAKRYESTSALIQKFLLLDKKLKEGDHRNLVVERKKLPDFPRIREVIYIYKDVFFIKYERKE